MISFLNGLSFNAKRYLYILLSSIATVAIACLSYLFGLAVPIIIIAGSFAIILQIVLFSYPKMAIYVVLVYCFTFGILNREIGGDLPYGTLIEVFIGLAYIYALIKIPVEKWKVVKTDLFYILLFWFLISVIEVANPAGASVMGWLQEIRASALHLVLLVPLGYLFFDSERDLNTFIKVIIFFSLLAALNGIKQLHIGPTPGEQRFLNDNANTHMLYGKLRVFSFYSDAGQFGASQASFCVMALILAFGPFKTWKRLFLLSLSGIFFYGMLISGTRGAFFVLVVGFFLGIVLSRNWKVILIGGAFSCMFLGVLKYTYIGNANYQIYRLRSALDPADASLNVRVMNQKILTEYLSTRPFGGGLGVIGAWGAKYNQDKFLASVPPDSYWVKVWAMYGIVGFTLWFAIMMYILGKCCGIIWNLKDPALRIKITALTAGFAGILFCSYGNEVINGTPSSIIVYISWVLIFISPKLDKEIKLNLNRKNK